MKPKIIEKNNERFIIIVTDQVIPNGFEILVSDDDLFWTSGIVALKKYTEIKLPENVVDSYVNIDIYNNFGKKTLPRSRLFIPSLNGKNTHKTMPQIGKKNINLTEAIIILSLFICGVIFFYKSISPATNWRLSMAPVSFGRVAILSSKNLLGFGLRDRELFFVNTDGIDDVICVRKKINIS